LVGGSNSIGDALDDDATMVAAAQLALLQRQLDRLASEQATAAAAQGAVEHAQSEENPGDAMKDGQEAAAGDGRTSSVQVEEEEEIESSSEEESDQECEDLLTSSGPVLSAHATAAGATTVVVTGGGGAAGEEERRKRAAGEGDESPAVAAQSRNLKEALVYFQTSPGSTHTPPAPASASATTTSFSSATAGTKGLDGAVDSKAQRRETEKVRVVCMI
jgi:hypothetical protein